MIISLIAAIGNNAQLGKDNKLLWHISDDLKNFKSLTLNKPIVMGRKTFESIGKPLPKRPNLILTRDQDYEQEGCFIFHKKEDIYQWANFENMDELVIIGGSEIYQLFLPEVDRIYLTRVDYSGPADVYFPELDWSDWKLSEEKKYAASSDHPGWSFHVYESAGS